MARPRKLPAPQLGNLRIEIDFGILERLCVIQCTLAEVAAFFAVSEDTIERRVKEEYGVKFADYYATKKGAGKAALRRKMFDLAEEGNVTLLIWLSKNYLGMSDKQTIGGTGGDITIRVSHWDDLERAIREESNQLANIA